MRARRAASQEGRHGDRWERRRLWASTALNDYLNDYLDWPGPAWHRSVAWNGLVDDHH